MLALELRDGSWVLKAVWRFIFGKEINKKMENIEERVIGLINV